MTIESFDRPTLKVLELEIKMAMEQIAARHGLKFAVKGGKFDSGMFSPKMEFTTAGGVGPEAKYLQQFGHLYGIPAHVLGKDFVYKGKAYKVAGMKSGRNTSANVIATSAGKTYKFPSDLAKFVLKPLIETGV